ncbi:ubiquitin-like protein Pup [Saccharopolyspora sp. NPDC000995]
MRREKCGHRTWDEDAAVVEPTVSGRQRPEKPSDDLENILDEIDDVLEKNAERFVRSYIQRGGE